MIAEIKLKTNAGKQNLGKLTYKKIRNRIGKKKK